MERFLALLLTLLQTPVVITAPLSGDHVRSFNCSSLPPSSRAITNITHQGVSISATVSDHSTRRSPQISSPSTANSRGISTSQDERDGAPTTTPRSIALPSSGNTARIRGTSTKGESESKSSHVSVPNSNRTSYGSFRVSPTTRSSKRITVTISISESSPCSSTGTTRVATLTSTVRRIEPKTTEAESETLSSTSFRSPRLTFSSCTVITLNSTGNTSVISTSKFRDTFRLPGTRSASLIFYPSSTSASLRRTTSITKITHTHTVTRVLTLRTTPKSSSKLSVGQGYTSRQPHNSLTFTIPSKPSLKSADSSLPVSLETVLITSEIQTLRVKVATSNVSPGPSGIFRTSLNTKGHNTAAPFNTCIIPEPSEPIRTEARSAIISTTVTMSTNTPLSGNIFTPIVTNAPPSNIDSRSDHPVPRHGINESGPIETNKFYANFFLGNRSAPTWTHPYSVAWVRGVGVSKSWGIGVSHVNRSQTVYGPGSPANYFINPVGIQSIIVSASELGGSTSLTMDQLRAFSCNINLSPLSNSRPILTFPLVQGMGFVTGIYENATPQIQTIVFFRSLRFEGKVGSPTSTDITVRYSITLMDDTVWFLYISPRQESNAPALTLVNKSEILGNHAFSGSVQIAKAPQTTDLSRYTSIYDNSAGVYPIRGGVRASVNPNNRTEATYSLFWAKGGAVGKTLLMFALPHHVQSFTSATRAVLRGPLQLQTTTKGLATAVYANSWTMQEHDLPFDMGFAPWSPTLRSQVSLPAIAVRLINQVAPLELNEDFTAQTNLDSMYFSGKGLAKFASAIFVVNNLARNTALASTGLTKLKSSFARFVQNNQIFPLVYDSGWGGVVSSASYQQPGNIADFGNSYYNDHHFHYGYFVYTAAVIGFLDPSWLQEGGNKAWVNMLVRDYANSATNDGYFPFSRMFDWYHGHSWAHGLFESLDGKDQESSSEDVFASYAIKMWGRTIHDANMEARGNLMLAIQARSLGNYFLMESNNMIQPPRFIGNKAAGILFENKIDHTTYFGTNPEYIEGIHMLPLNPSSTLTRRATFVSEEWNTYFSNGRVDNVIGGWRGILHANLAIISPATAWKFFSRSDFDNTWLDGGASRTWYLAWCAGLGGVQ